jgi:hypothetical protein
MSKEIAVAATQLAITRPEAQRALSLMAEAAGPEGFTLSDLDRITVPSGGGAAWEIPTLDGDVSVREFHGVILAAQDVRRYYQMSVEQSDGSAPPDCSSANSRVGIGTPGGDCALCPLSQFGSDARGVGQACKAYKMLIVLPPDEIKPIILSIPPTSIKAARKYLLNLASRAVGFAEVVSSFALTKVKSGNGVAYSQVVPTMVRRLSDQEISAVALIRATLIPSQEALRTASAPADDAVVG